MYNTISFNNNFVYQRTMFFMGILSKIFGDPNQKIIKSLNPIIDKINSLEEKYKNFSENDVKKETLRFKEILANKKGEELQNKLNEILPEAFAGFPLLIIVYTPKLLPLFIADVPISILTAKTSIDNI